MGEINNGELSPPETNGSEVSEAAEADDFMEMDDELSQDLDEYYNAYLEDKEYKGMKSEVNESADSKDENDKTETFGWQERDDFSSISLEEEMDKKYNEYIENGKEGNGDNPENISEKIKCRNEKYEGMRHPETGVPFEKRNVEVDGKQYEVVVPKFESIYDVQLPENKLKDVDREQFKECNTKLKEEIENNKELREQFDEEQLEQIRNGDTPDGYTWHHDADIGKMQLVETEIHQKTGHTGGRSIWGGGSNNRF